MRQDNIIFKGTLDLIMLSVFAALLFVFMVVPHI